MTKDELEALFQKFYDMPPIDCVVPEWFVDYLMEVEFWESING